ncbi:MAG: sulfatase-like hydrolase/transferase [Planctomycetota bacterium]
MPSNSLRLFSFAVVPSLVLALTGSLDLLGQPQASAIDTSSAERSRPNIVWIMSEDNSKHYLRHFDSDGAAAPNIEAMAKHGITFDRAFSNAPVCSVARTTLITSCYGPRIGTQYHRRSRLASMPNGLKMFPAYLRSAGYYTTNRSKEDYNAHDDSEPWDESSNQASWKNRPSKKTPFFHVRTFADSHESRLHFPKRQMNTATDTDPSTVKLQPYFPDTPTFRYTRARYHDRMQVIDELVGGVLDELKSAGELEHTFVFYFGDHGGVLPRSKGYIYDSGLHVPLVIRVPDQFQDLGRRELGSRTNGFVEFVDFGPTVLALAGVDVPPQVDGKPFLGSNVDPGDVDDRDTTFGHADRFDERCELIRSLRVGDWKYVRHFEGYLPDGLHNFYRYKMLAFDEWRKRHHAGQLDEIQDRFFQSKPAESLYNLSTDPHEINDLASQPEHAERLIDLRNRLMDRMKTMPDLSLFPEKVLYETAMEDPVRFGREHSERINRLLEVANLSLLPFDDSEDRLRRAMGSDDPWERYWALTACSQFGKQALALRRSAQDRLDDSEPLVATRAAEFLAIVDEDFSPWPTLRRALAASQNDPEANSILNSVVFLRDVIGSVDDENGPLTVGFSLNQKDQAMRRLEYLKVK